MIINGKQALVYDLKVFKNVFTCTFLDTESDDVEVYEVSMRKNQMEDIVGIFRYPGYIFLGYNTIHYSVPIMSFIMENMRTIPSNHTMICNSIYELSKTIITSDNFSDWAKWKHTRNFLTLDFYTMLASSKNRVGLKEMQITSDYPDVREMPFSYDEQLSPDKIDEMLSYSLNDAKSIKHLAYKVEPEIRFREDMSKQFDINLLSKDNVSLGLEIVKKKYLERTSQEWNAIKDKKSPQDIINLNDCVPDFLEFNSQVLKDLVKELKETTINLTNSKQYDKKFLLNDGFQNDIELSFGMGGLHSIVDSDIIVPNSNEVLVDVDVRSMYPSIILSYEIVPKHLNKSAFLYIFREIWNERLKAKDNGNESYSKGLKHALNSIIGNYRVYSSWLYGPASAVHVNVLGQLFILKLAEMLISSGAKIVQVNTDGIMFIINKDFNYNDVLNEWMGLTCLTLESERFERLYQYDVNNYLAIKDDGTIKQKGIFSDERIIGRGMKPRIIAKAITKYFTDGINPEDTIKNSTDILDFLTYQKVDKKYVVEYDDKQVQRINRYYASINGYSLYKCEIGEGSMVQTVIVHFKDGTYNRVPKPMIEIGGEYFNNPSVSHFEYNSGWTKLTGRRSKYENLLKSSGVIIVNNLDDIKEFPKDINYRYYIAEAKKIISQLENRQLSLF